MVETVELVELVEVIEVVEIVEIVEMVDTVDVVDIIDVVEPVEVLTSMNLPVSQFVVICSQRKADGDKNVLGFCTRRLISQGSADISSVKLIAAKD
jgi:hypothetical protein